MGLASHFKSPMNWPPLTIPRMNWPHFKVSRVGVQQSESVLIFLIITFLNVCLYAVLLETLSDTAVPMLGFVNDTCEPLAGKIL